MSASNRNLLVILGGLALVAAFWFMILGPKRDKAAELGSKVDELEKSVAAEKDRAEFAEQAREEFPHNYQRLVVLGKAVPENADTASYLVQMSEIADQAGVDFRGIELDDSAGAAAPAAQPGVGAAPPATSQPSAEAAPGEEPQPASAASPAAAPAPTEATASTLPIGATIGPAGLPLQRYKLNFSGDFFNVSSFVQGLDRMVSDTGGRVVVDGRLTTIDGFALTADKKDGLPKLNASFIVTTFLTPPEQGLTAGATPTAPPAVPGQEPLQTASTGGSE